MADVPVGSICVWPSSDPVPTGWQVCDGTNGTPDLRDRFVPCVGSAYGVGDTGGGAGGAIPSHTHPAGANTQADYSHTHDGTVTSSEVDASASSYGGGTIPATIASPTSHTHDWPVNYLATNHHHDLSGETGAAAASSSGECLPPFTALYYIQRIA